MKHTFKKHLCAVLRPDLNRQGRHLDAAQKTELKQVGLTPTKWTQIRLKGPKTVHDLCAMAILMKCEPGDLIDL